MTARRLFFTLFTIAFFLLLVFPGIVAADPCLVVYPTSPATYHYDVNEYYTVTAGHSLYDPMYDRGGEVLIDINTNEIAFEVYQIPNLTGFVQSTNGEEGYFFIGSDFDLGIDGFSNQPTTYSNILLVFVPDPEWCTPSITVDGDPVVGNTYAIGDLVVSTPTADGNNYSDTITKHIQWSTCLGIRIYAFADEDYNGVKDGGECFPPSPTTAACRRRRDPGGLLRASTRSELNHCLIPTGGTDQYFLIDPYLKKIRSTIISAANFFLQRGSASCLNQTLLRI
ncbi:MAG: hypothetical protein GTO51_06440 [Candidatus Latescibacteria bacterium]|nr:hypothetical protein [Candidatus Latescibacterota bacterium]NIM21430.1 hypothetical protein [Candidatus Latescibacterota bacterium]NIM65611.1 hypothetical protein [Candidatus Latescibacterota bacterium]NIO01991.1 hypothetical protein [Candidatus Latescibacterota bacterium]NIO28803.1 hypothetical protein [Candidatus Latescibacterota bacterium]